MLTSYPHIRISFVFALASVTLFTTAAVAQNGAARTESPDKEVLSVQLTASGGISTKTPTLPSSGTVTATTKPAAEPTPEPLADGTKAVPKSTPNTGDLEAEVAAIKAENAEVKEQLRRMAEGQKILIEQLDRLRRRLDAGTTANASSASRPIAPLSTADASAPPPGASPADASAPPPDASPNASSGNPDPASTTAGRVAAKVKQAAAERYQDGIIIWATPDDAKVPFMLRFNNNTQIRYLNTLDSNETFTDHLGNVRDVHRRNDITVNRSMFIFNGYIWDKRLFYSLTVWTSAGASSIVVAGNIGWRFSKYLTLIAGYNGVPGSRSLVNTFPYYTATDRSMADNFFRPGFTQGMWAVGDITKDLHYMGFVGNSINTISISAAKIDTNLLLSGSVWWEPLGAFGERGKSVNMYDDYFAKKEVRVRLGTSFTRSPEDRFSNLDVSSPENTALYNSDGVLTFSTGAFAPGVTVDQALYKMWAIDGGLKYDGLAINGQYFMRWLNDFVADGPLPVSSTFDHGYELSASYFVIPKKLVVYGRSSQVFGQFGNSYEYGGGVKWHFLPTERLWLNAELFRINRAPYSGAFTPYTAGMTGWVPMIQTVIAF